MEAGVLLLPLAFWAGLEHPFVTPKLWLLAALDVSVALRCLASKTPPWAGWPLLAWAAAMALSAVVAPYVSLEALLLAALPLPLFFAGLPARALLWGSAAESAIALAQYAGLDPLRLFWSPEAFPAGSRMRVYGTLGNPDFVAAWLCATLPLYAAAQGRRRVLGCAGLALQLAAIFATGSRMPVVALPVAAIVLAWRAPRMRRWALAALPLAALAAWLSPARSLGITIEGRLYLARVAASRWSETPPAGYGPGAFPLVFARRQVEWLDRQGPGEPGRRFAGPLDHAHNDYLEVFVDYGPLGLGAFLWLCGWRFKTAWRGSDPAVLAAAAALLAIACFDFPFHRPAEWGLLWLLMGMLRPGGAANSPSIGSEQKGQICLSR
jgi:hypothetical protein